MQQQTNAPEQPLEDSGVEDRIASLFGGSEPEETVETEQPEETDGATETTPEETFELELEGEKFVLPKKLEKGFMQERDYTQKSQSLAEQRRTLEHVQQQLRMAQVTSEFQQSIAQERQQIGMIDAFLKQQGQRDWSNMSAEEMFKARVQLDQYKEAKAELEKSLETKQQEHLSRQQQELQKLQSQSMEIVRKAVPGWNEQIAKEVREHALNEGYTTEELGSIYDPRHAVTLWKAAQYDKAKAQAKPVTQQGKTVKANPSNPMSAQTKNYLNFRKTIDKAKPGSREYKGALEDRIASKFGA